MKNLTREQIAARRAELDREEAALDAEDRRIASLSDDERLAEELHTMLCKWNHADGCGWFYEIQGSIVNWSGHAHNLYLSKARKAMDALPGLSVDEIFRVLSAVK